MRWLSSRQGPLPTSTVGAEKVTIKDENFLHLQCKKNTDRPVVSPLHHHSQNSRRCSCRGCRCQSRAIDRLLPSARGRLGRDLVMYK